MEYGGTKSRPLKFCSRRVNIRLHAEHHVKAQADVGYSALQHATLQEMIFLISLGFHSGLNVAAFTQSEKTTVIYGCCYRIRAHILFCMQEYL